MRSNLKRAFSPVDYHPDVIQLETFIDQAARSTTLNELFQLLEAAIASLGFEFVAYGALANCHGIVPRADVAPAVFLNYPQEWQKHYFSHHYQEIDPVITRTAGMTGPYIWSDWCKSGMLALVEQEVFYEAADAGLREGVSIPLHGPFGSLAVVSFASKDQAIDAVSVLSKLHVIAAEFHLCCSALSPQDPTEAKLLTLTPKQRECLSWVSQGKSSWDIGVILGISENTVNFHLKEILRKLGTSSRTVAVVKAIRLGLITI
jgi:DNA-binding CsgD family transcriptional regulator